MDVLENVKTALSFRDRENLLPMLAGLKTIKEKERLTEESALKILDKLDLTEYKNRNVTGLPYGIRRMVEVARALSLEPDILILDEPVAGMNHTESQTLMTKVMSLLMEGITVILIEHDMQVVMNFSDQITVFNHGQVIACGKPNEIQKNSEVIEAYLGKNYDEEEAGGGAENE